MNKNDLILRYSLLACTAYFLVMAAAHVTGFKVPVLFVYFDVPSHQYQDTIISFCCVGWAGFSYAAANNRGTLAPFLLTFSGVVIGLSYINLTTDFQTLKSGLTTTPYWVQTGILSGLVAWLIVFYRLTANNEQPHASADIE